MINKNKAIPPSVFSRSRATLGFWAILLEVTSFSAVVAAISKRENYWEIKEKYCFQSPARHSFALNKIKDHEKI